MAEMITDEPGVRRVAFQKTVYDLQYAWQFMHGVPPTAALTIIEADNYYLAKATWDVPL